jgi:hypothetical protein
VQGWAISPYSLTCISTTFHRLLMALFVRNALLQSWPCPPIDSLLFRCYVLHPHHHKPQSSVQSGKYSDWTRDRQLYSGCMFSSITISRALTEVTVRGNTYYLHAVADRSRRLPYSGLSLEWIEGIKASHLDESAYPQGNHRVSSKMSRGAWRAHMNATRT